ncbi:MAG: hypothetical protein HN826_12005 [Methylococcales bacterium]|nr:hypothetical protein [Methylococcales bacterium]
MASIFQHWDERGRHRVSEQWYSDMETRGFNNVKMPIKFTESSVQWLAQEIVKDPRFVKATVKVMYTGLTGRKPINSQLLNSNENADLREAYVSQRNMLNSLEQQFIAEGYNLKKLAKNIILSAYWRADSLENGVSDTTNTIGSSRLLTPEMLDRKIQAILGFTWKRRSYDSQSRLAGNRNNGYRQLYGGIDSDLVNKRITQVNGMMTAVQKRMVTELSCKAVTLDFFKVRQARQLFPQVSINTSPVDDDGFQVPSAINAIKQNIKHLHWVMHGDSLEIDDVELQHTYDLFNQLKSAGHQLLNSNFNKYRYLPSSCRLYYHPETGERLSNTDEIVLDEDYSVRAWMGVLAYLMSDFKFVYE